MWWEHGFLLSFDFSCTYYLWLDGRSNNSNRWDAFFLHLSKIRFGDREGVDGRTFVCGGPFLPAPVFFICLFSSNLNMPAISKKILHQPYLKYHHFSPWISSIYCSCSNVWKRCILSFSDVLDADKLQDQNRRRNFSQLDSNPTLTIKKYEISLFS